jgi:hypothetical protein
MFKCGFVRSNFAFAIFPYLLSFELMTPNISQAHDQI